MKESISAYLDTAEAISTLLCPFAEVIIHDLEKNQVEAVFNPFSDVDVGDLSYLDRNDLEMKSKNTKVIGPYEKIDPYGRKIKSISIIIKDQKGLAVGMLSINLDISVFSKYKEIQDLRKALSIFSEVH